MKRLKHLIFVLALLLGAAHPASACIRMFTLAGAVQSPLQCSDTDSNAAGDFTSTTTSQVYSLSGVDWAFITGFSAGSSVSSSAIEVSPTGSAPWYAVTAATPIVNPTSTGGETWAIPGSGFVRINHTKTSGSAVRFLMIGKLNGKTIF